MLFIHFYSFLIQVFKAIYRSSIRLVKKLQNAQENKLKQKKPQTNMNINTEQTNCFNSQ